MIENIISKFTLSGILTNAERFGSGLINDTYLCEFREASGTRKYILQLINASVFKHPEQVMENVEAVTTHIMNRLQKEGVADPSQVAPALIPARDGRSYYRDGAGSYWRMFHFLEDGQVYDKITDVRHAFEIGRGLGRFQRLVSDLAPEKLYDTLPGFHFTPRFLQEYDNAVKADRSGRVALLESEISFISSRRVLAPVLTGLMDEGVVPLRVVHNDPKVNNIMINHRRGEALCMIDLDTVKPGIVHFDFGDCVRSAANPAGEDAEDLSMVKFDLSVFEAVASGYLREAGVFLTPKEIEFLPVSVKVITFELGLRFLTDYLNGDTYFKIRHPAHNLHRARVQFKLLESVEAAEDHTASFIAHTCRRV